MNPHLAWYVARASGLVAWGLSTASVLWGLALATRALGNRPRPPWLLDLHRFLGGLTVVFVGVHIGGLVADNTVRFGAREVLLPFGSPWRPAAVAWGVIAFYLLVAIEITSLLMRRIPKKWWHRVHLTSYGVFALSATHAITAGTEGGMPIVRWGTLISVSATAFFLLYRVLAPRRGAAAARLRAAKGARLASEG